jgi:hypothetical protein
MLSRRRMLLTAAAGISATAVVGGGAWVSVGYVLRPGEAAIGLSVKQLVVARAIVEALVPADGDLPGGVELGVHQRIDEEVWSASDVLAADLRAAIELLEHLPVLYGFAGRLSSLAVDQRIACLEAYLRSSATPIVQAAQALKQLCMVFYFTRSGTWQAIGYDGPWVKEPVPPASSLHYAALLGRAL